MNQENLDFDLDLQVDVNSNPDESGLTSISLCTPGCVTGWLQGCANKTATCHCSF